MPESIQRSCEGNNFMETRFAPFSFKKLARSGAKYLSLALAMEKLMYIVRDSGWSGECMILRGTVTFMLFRASN